MSLWKHHGFLEVMFHLAIGASEERLSVKLQIAGPYSCLVPRPRCIYVYMHLSPSFP